MLLITLIVFFAMPSKPDGLAYLGLGMTGVFIMYEVIQLWIQRLDYFKDMANWLDMIRFGLIISCIINFWD